MQRDVTVTFTNGQISVNPDPVKPKKNDDTVNWAGRVQFTIQGLPGGDIVATGSGSQWSASAGPFSTVTTYKYNVAATGYPTLDPEIEIQP